MKKIFTEEGYVVTLAELAKVLADRYGWSVSKVEMLND